MKECRITEYIPCQFSTPPSGIHTLCILLLWIREDLTVGKDGTRRTYGYDCMLDQEEKGLPILIILYGSFSKESYPKKVYRIAEDREILKNNSKII
ncbi:hypothetical protein HGM15179_003821 [Zosterops borbonicus]|uniref:Uncharacterized protein n=1 Tax=Zosterops borbonicus TaxID=364589 RepID=A0A8K1LRC8_9PASS|nr:hypothetical protein HGM15179_003821 [Zosterops borbonicus]